ncbi:MAG: gliding motility-associated C-terminal domain-containing protein [Flavobacteriales bacterium]|nr:gliding motility-associated C-terminal domain-containing protein [Flavobacteriales bacterium]
MWSNRWINNNKWIVRFTTYDITYDDDGVLVTLTGVTTDAAGNFIITGLDAGAYDNWSVTLIGCTGTDVTLITLVDPGAPSFTVSRTDPTTCSGADGTITYSGLLASTSYDITYDDGSGSVTVTVMSDASGNIVVTGLTSGGYNGFIVSLLGCVASDASTITLVDPITPTAPVAGSDSVYCIGDVLVDLTAIAGFGGDLNWYSDPGLTTFLATGANFTPTGAGIYYVNEAVLASGCVGPASSVTITVSNCVVIEVEIPTGFTPDNDGVNDTWQIPNLNTMYPNSTVRVFNRWGAILFESNGYPVPWDGGGLPVGSYYFIIAYGDDSVKDATGSVTIVR